MDEIMKEQDPHKQRITLDPSIHFGRPCVANTRIPVDNILELLELNILFEDIIELYYPDLEVEDIKACIRYARDLVRSNRIDRGYGQ
jgi:uncharacterized protein (DUF433 family)